MWNLHKKGQFSTKSFYAGLEQLENSNCNFSGVWSKEVPSKVDLFIWTIVLDNILTFTHLQSRGWNLANRCIMCLKVEESIDHLFFHCQVVSEIWVFFLSHLNISWAFQYLSKTSSFVGGLVA